MDRRTAGLGGAERCLLQQGISMEFLKVPEGFLQLRIAMNGITFMRSFAR